MALYRKGTASLAADGTVTGKDTKWKDQLALIRVGATIIFLDQPIKLAVISDIVSDTELKVIANEGDTAPDGNYVILLHDSLTVNGLAQNVAETLRYYQSKETEIAGAMDTIANLDMDNLNNIVAEVQANRAAAEAARNESDSSAQAAAASASEAGNIKSQIETLIDGSVNTINNAKDKAITEIGAKESSVITHIDTEEAAAIQAINDAKGDLSTYVNDAQTAAQTATAAKNDAQSARDEAVSAKDSAAQSAQEAKDAAASVDSENLLQKDKNLSDVPDKEAARTALDVPAKGEVFLIENNLSEIADRAAAWLNVRPLGATPLGGDAVGDNDAVTLRQVQNLINGGGGVGPTMNGVQNFGIGEKILWDSRAFFPAWSVPLDGQLLKRDEWPELWAHAQMHSPIVDSDWLAAPSNRGRWSRGDDSTTFRCPDLNGVQDGSIIGLYGRGDAGGKYNTGSVLENGVPNISGEFGGIANIANKNYPLPITIARGSYKLGASGGVRTIGTVSSSQEPTGSGANTALFDASLSNKAFGRASEVRPNSFVGVWIVRASGGFTAANTSWSVINDRGAEADVGVWSAGGAIRSSYKESGVEKAACSITVSTAVDSKGYRNARMNFNLSNKEGADFSFFMTEKGAFKSGNGTFTFDSPIFNSGSISTNGIFQTNFVSQYTAAIRLSPASDSAAYILSTVKGTNNWYIGKPSDTDNVTYWHNYIFNTQASLKQAGLYCTKAMYATAFNPTSDRRLKSLIETIPDPLDIMKSMRGYSWYYDADGRQGFGFMADEAEKFFPGAITVTKETELADGNKVENLKSVDTYGIAAALHHEAILALMNEVKELREEIKKLKGE